MLGCKPVIDNLHDILISTKFHPLKMFFFFFLSLGTHGSLKGPDEVNRQGVSAFKVQLSQLLLCDGTRVWGSDTALQWFAFVLYINGGQITCTDAGYIDCLISQHYTDPPCKCSISFRQWPLLSMSLSLQYSLIFLLCVSIYSVLLIIS